MANIILKIDVKKIRKDWLFTGQKGIYADLVVFENDQPDEYGNSHAIKQNPTKEARENGEKGVYVGNGKWMESRNAPPQRQTPQQRQAPQRQAPAPAKVANGWDEEDTSGVPF